ncbi:MAG: 30S ribosome-binding factor RbfA [Ignavibacteriales bacterium]|jgi:ribosome-binding factor A|nr:30S ribosome-binding factor RbfA [Ignavibacteriaceae bacterium]NLH62438.1 30S ribosome-binding factor RbfA [Ignavibacteriales bacterium]HOJ18685.1 30S ribosome-binding factor RbfA [Ignavibacteriaceae bacterium]HPO55181.1 30S ribosome-binding factor RbfA [Ignavibacteriaceae bacterium]
MSVRTEKISELIKKEISIIFLQKINDPALGMLTITDVKVTPDVKIAKIYISVFNKEKRADTLSKIESINGYIRSELAHRIKLRFVPELKFFIDETLDYVEKIESLIKKTHEND